MAGHKKKTFDEIIREELVAITQERYRRDKKQLTKKERAKYLQRIYDGSLAWLEQCVIGGHFRGSAAVTLIMERARLELESMGEFDVAKKKAPSKDGIIFDL